MTQKDKAKTFLEFCEKQMTHQELSSLAHMVAQSPIQVIRDFVEAQDCTALQYALAKAFLRAADVGDIYSINHFLDRLVGRSQASVAPQVPIDGERVTSVGATFLEFCERAGYPEPYEQQIEMVNFGIHGGVQRLLLGSRGYGKTDYVVILGLAYEVYKQPTTYRALIVTKSDERNTSIISEIAKACEANGVRFEKRNTSCLRASGLIGKDNSVSVATLGSVSFRGRHPDIIVLDDPVTEEDVSPATRAKAQRVYNELNKLTQNILIIGQPVHKQDLYETLRPLVKKSVVPWGSIPELDIDLEALSAAGVSRESISASYHLKVISENPTPFEGVKYLDVYPAAGTSVAFIDPSFEGGDYTAMTIAKAHFDGIAIKGRTFKRAWNHCLDEIVAESIACGVKRICFETNSLGDMPIELLRAALPAGIGVVGKKSTNNKHSRIMNAGVFAHLIHLSKTSDREYISQVTGYEYNAKYDDAPDSLASLLEWLGLIRGKRTR